MIFRGDGKNNIISGNCFAKYLAPTTVDGNKTARFVGAESRNPPVTKVMMNPPFSLKRGDEKEYKFVDQALRQMEHDGLLFSVLPYSTMVRPGKYRTWRREVLLPHQTLVAVVTLPGDLFYPVGVTTVGVFVRKGVPHPRNQNVLWIRALNDGLLKSKGRRLPNARAADDLSTVRDILRNFLNGSSATVQNRHQFLKAAPIDFEDRLLELVPEAYLDQAKPTHEMVVRETERSIRELFSFLIKTDNAVLSPHLMTKKPSLPFSVNTKWKAFNVTEIFKLKRGDFHSIADLDAGKFPTISRVSTDNGLVGFFEQPPGARIYKPGTLTVSTVTGDAFLQPIPFIATDNVVLCTPKENYSELRLSTLLFIQVMLNEVKWRYSYGRQCYMGKFASTEIMLPVNRADDLDEDYMASVVEMATYWPFVAAVFSK
jgi:type I restriction enzyme M protein